jgi:hypothetical protein
MSSSTNTPKRSCVIESIKTILEHLGKFTQYDVLELKLKTCGYQGGEVDGETVMSLLNKLNLVFSFVSCVYMPCAYMLVEDGEWVPYIPSRRKDGKWMLSRGSTKSKIMTLDSMIRKTEDDQAQGFIIYRHMPVPGRA